MPEGAGMSGTERRSPLKEQGWRMAPLREGQGHQSGPLSPIRPDLRCPHPRVFTPSTHLVPEDLRTCLGEPGLRLLFPGCRKGSASSA